MRKFRRFALLSLLVGMVIGTMPACAAEPTSAPDEMTGVKIGDKAPDFTLTDQNGEEHSLSALLAGDDTVVLVFYRSANW